MKIRDPPLNAFVGLSKLLECSRDSECRFRSQGYFRPTSIDDQRSASIGAVEWLAARLRRSAFRHSTAVKLCRAISLSTQPEQIGTASVGLLMDGPAAFPLS